MNKIIALLLLALSSCRGPIFESICQEQGKRRACTNDEQAMIDSMHKILREVLAFDKSHLEHEFAQVSNSRKPQLLIFGENHAAAIGKVKTLGAINQLAQKGAVVLLEGADKSTQFDFNDCGKFLLYRIFTNIEYQKAYGHYVPHEVPAFIERKNFLKLYKNTELSYDLKGTSLNHLRCYYWDHAPSLKETDTTPANMKMRNSSMITAIEAQLLKKAQIFVITGYGHIPLGEVIKFPIKRMSIPYENHVAEMNDYYPKAKKERKLPYGKAMDITDNCAASSRVLFKFLKTVPHTQYIHVRMLIRPYEEF